ncbi:MAG: hypothetical protein HY319_01180 [Armatimonadetes bacterium]|nr:hypothetical protein [Armatimonadota bacterium]
MKWQESESVRQVREWRAKVAEKYEGLPREEVIKRLNEVGRRHRELMEAEKKLREPDDQAEADDPQEQAAP